MAIVPANFLPKKPLIQNIDKAAKMVEVMETLAKCSYSLALVTSRREHTAAKTPDQIHGWEGGLCASSDPIYRNSIPRYGRSLQDTRGNPLWLQLVWWVSQTGPFQLWHSFVKCAPLFWKRDSLFCVAVNGVWMLFSNVIKLFNMYIYQQGWAFNCWF